MSSFLRFLLLFPLAMALLVGPHFMAACNRTTPQTPKITAPKQTPPVAPSAQKTVTQTGKVVDSIDGANIYAEQVNDLDPAKKPLITGLTNARAEAVRAVEQATETHDLAVAKDAEAKASQGALVEAIKAVKELAASEAKARGERDALQEKWDEVQTHWLGPRTHRWIKGMFWTLVVGGGVLIALGVLGSMYGLPKLTQPVFGSVGGLLEGVRVLLYKAATAIWAAIPFGHYPDEFLNKHGQMARATKQPVSNPYKLEPLHIYPTMSATDTLRMNDGVANHTKGGV